MKFKCKENCEADCCGGIRFNIKKWNKLKHKAQTTDNIIERVSRNEVFIVCRKDMLCVFLDRKTRKCAIYDERPTICRLYGTSEKIPCPYLLPDGSPRPDIKSWEKVVDKDFNDLKKKLEAEQKQRKRW